MYEVLACQSSLLVLAPPARKGAACLSAAVPLGRSLRTIIVESHLEPGWSACVKVATPHGRARLALGLRGSLRRRPSVSVDTRVVSSSPHGVLGTRTWRPHPAAPLWSSKAHGCYASWGSSCLRSCLPSAPASAAYRGVASPPAAVRACYPSWASWCWVSS